jgi:hypothetical protein
LKRSGDVYEPKKGVIQKIWVLVLMEDKLHIRFGYLIY